MECNRHDAEKCIAKAKLQMEIAYKHLEKARDALIKSERMYPTQEAKDLLATLYKKTLPYTEEEAEVVTEVVASKDPYSILRLRRHDNLAVDLIMRAFRELSLAVHPDKNKAPRADEAFHAVIWAKKILLQRHGATSTKAAPDAEAKTTDDKNNNNRQKHGDKQKSERRKGKKQKEYAC